MFNLRGKCQLERRRDFPEGRLMQIFRYSPPAHFIGKEEQGETGEQEGMLGTGEISCLESIFFTG